jgi:hypothetical protein
MRRFFRPVPATSRLPPRISITVEGGQIKLSGIYGPFIYNQERNSSAAASTDPGNRGQHLVDQAGTR